MLFRVFDLVFGILVFGLIVVDLLGIGRDVVVGSKIFNFVFVLETGILVVKIKFL